MPSRGYLTRATITKRTLSLATTDHVTSNALQLITDALCLKDGSGKELRALHDTVQQHVCALKILGCDLPGNFITPMIELILDINTLFEWQKYS